MEVSIARVQESAMLVATWSERGQRRAGFDRLFALAGSAWSGSDGTRAQVGVRRERWRRSLAHGLRRPWPTGQRLRRAQPPTQL